MEAALPLDHYEIPRNEDGTLLELGRGTMGVTYRATDTKLRVDVVLKLIHPQCLQDERALKMFLREARAAAKVRHPNIAAVISLHDEAPVYYTMEYVDGMSLSALLAQRGGRLPAGEALDYAAQVAAALSALEREHIVHRDLKPGNLMLLADDERPHGRVVKVIDFGLAKGFRTEDEDDVISYLDSSRSLPHFAGTPAYASPEQCAASRDVDTRSDIYTLGIILWECLSGSRPFSGSPVQVLAMHQFKDPPWEQLGRVPQLVIDLLRGMLAKAPEDRFQTPRQVRDAITRCLQEYGVGDEAGATIALTAPPIAAALPTEGTGPGSTAAEATQTLHLGTRLAERFRLGEMLGKGDGGRLFMAADTANDDEVVAVKILRRALLVDASADRLGDLQREIEAQRTLKHAAFLRPVLGLTRSGGSAFYAREWADGLSLLDLLRARGALQAAEAWRLLGSLPEALDEAARRKLTFAEPLLRKLFICLPPGVPAASLRTAPLEQWPEFRLRWNAVSFGAGSIGEASLNVTRSTEPAVSAAEDPVLGLAMLVREVLGGRPLAKTPLPALSDQADQVLQRAFASHGQGEGFGSAEEFWTALVAAGGRPARPGRTTTVSPLSPTVAFVPAGPDTTDADTRLGHESTLRARDSAPSTLRSDASRRRQVARMVAWGVMLVSVVLLAAVLIPRWRRVADEPEDVFVPAESPAPSPTPLAPPSPTPVIAVALPSPVETPEPPPTKSTVARVLRGEQADYVNSLRMRFVRVLGTEVLFCEAKTRVQDYRVFAADTARGQPPRGGIDTVPSGGDWAVGTFQLVAVDQATWERPGFAQSPDHPVVGVSWTEARAFSAWLTARERAGGLLLEQEFYRLPTDQEWTLAVGPGEPTWPWGDDFAAARGHGNYCDQAFAAAYPSYQGPLVSFNDGHAHTSPVTRFPPNAAGLRDLGGNAWEWCETEYRAALNQKAVLDVAPALRTEAGPDGTRYRVLRGASWLNASPTALRTDYRSRRAPSYRGADTGFRVVLAQKKSP